MSVVGNDGFDCRIVNYLFLVVTFLDPFAMEFMFV